jgi:hypothetical protein
MVLSTESAWDDIAEEFTHEYQDAVVYADRERETILHEGPLILLTNGWVTLPSGRLLSPDAVHHIDTYPDREA